MTPAWQSSRPLLLKVTPLGIWLPLPLFVPAVLMNVPELLKNVPVPP